MTIGSVDAIIKSYTDVEVVVEVTGLSAGAQDIKIAGNSGYALAE